MFTNLERETSYSEFSGIPGWRKTDLQQSGSQYLDHSPGDMSVSVHWNLNF